MAARRLWASLALGLQAFDRAWLEEFADGFFALADRYEVELIGGDTTRGPLNLCVTIIGEVPLGKTLMRSGARPGDVVWLSGKLGSAALGQAVCAGEGQAAEGFGGRGAGEGGHRDEGQEGGRSGR